jgi:hypothetical protein
VSDGESDGPISNTTALAVSRLWKAALLCVRPVAEWVIGSDGDTYQFAHGHLTGQAWAPEKDTVVASMIEVAEQTKALVTKGWTRGQVERDIERQVATTMQRLEGCAV